MQLKVILQGFFFFNALQFVMSLIKNEKKEIILNSFLIIFLKFFYFSTFTFCLSYMPEDIALIMETIARIK